MQLKLIKDIASGLDSQKYNTLKYYTIITKKIIKKLLKVINKWYTEEKVLNYLKKSRIVAHSINENSSNSLEIWHYKKNLCCPKHLKFYKQFLLFKIKNRLMEHKLNIINTKRLKGRLRMSFGHTGPHKKFSK